MSRDTDGNNSSEMLPHVSEEGDRSIRRGRDAIPPAFGNKNTLYYFRSASNLPVLMYLLKFRKSIWLSVLITAASTRSAMLSG